MPTSSTDPPIETPEGTGKRGKGAKPARDAAGEGASAPAKAGGAEARTFGGLTPREAALRKAEKERERKAAGENGAQEPDNRAEMTLVPVRVGAVVRSLEAKAAQGDVNAARELRPWLDRYPQDGDTKLDIATLTRRERDAVLAKVLAELGEEQAEAPANEVIR